MRMILVKRAWSVHYLISNKLKLKPIQRLHALLEHPKEILISFAYFPFSLPFTFVYFTNDIISVIQLSKISISETLFASHLSVFIIEYIVFLRHLSQFGLL